MSRNRKPLNEQQGNLTVAQQENIRQTEQATAVEDKQLRYAPRWLTDERAKEEWRRLVGELKKAGLACNLDRNNIGMYCNCFSAYLKVCERLKELSPAADYEAYTALIRTQRTLIDDMMKISRTCGLTIDSRLKAGQIKVDKINNQIEDTFGDI